MLHMYIFCLQTLDSYFFLEHVSLLSFRVISMNSLIMFINIHAMWSSLNAVTHIRVYFVLNGKWPNIGSFELRKPFIKVDVSTL